MKLLKSSTYTKMRHNAWIRISTDLPVGSYWSVGETLSVDEWFTIHIHIGRYIHDPT